MSTNDSKHTWSVTVENLGCALIAALFVLAVLAVCTWGWIQTLTSNPR
jgi:hypothetical protein